MATTSIPTVQTVIEAIIDGAYDDDLDSIFEAFKTRERARRTAQAAKAAATFKRGDRVRIVGDVRPKHYVGREGVITDKARTKFTVQLDGDAFPLRVPGSVLEAA